MQKNQVVFVLTQVNWLYVCVFVSVVVGVDAELDESSVSDVVQCEGRIVFHSRALLPAVFQSHMQCKVDELDELLRLLGSETQLVVLSRVNSIALFFVCKTLFAVMSLRHHWCTQQFKGIISRLFTFLSGFADSDLDTREVCVKRLTWSATDYEGCSEFFSLLHGK